MVLPVTSRGFLTYGERVRVYFFEKLRYLEAVRQHHTVWPTGLTYDQGLHMEAMRVRMNKNKLANTKIKRAL